MRQCATPGGPRLAQGPRLPRIYQKYCSTFDSTAAGNIGPVTDALLAALGQHFTLICPACR